MLEAAKDLLKHMPTSELGRNLALLCKLQPDLTEELLEEVDQPLKTLKCEKTGHAFVICDHNRDGDSFRSPFSNEYQPAFDGIQPSPRLRKMEVAANGLFQAYADAYYGNSTSSVYLWDLDEGFAGAILIHKSANKEGGVSTGCWDSIHVLEAEEKDQHTVYTLTTTIMLHLATEDGSLKLSGRLSVQNEAKESAGSDKDHLTHIGNLVQKVENGVRHRVDEVYFGKAVEITSEVRSKASLKQLAAQADVASQLAAKLAGRAKG
ncbi:F-actin-capping protein subunit beta [Diplonema papillatum]|nr:F-actin-capping protein subunit beta [Diplonema papillatum]|eukprot:gene23330-35736_t